MTFVISKIAEALLMMLVVLAILRSEKVPEPVKVTFHVNVLAPAKVCVPVVTTPPKDAEAGSRFRVEPDIVAPFAFGVEPIAASVVTPEPPPEPIHTLLIEKQPAARLIPPVEEKEEVAVEKLIPLVVPIERSEPGVLVPIPTFPPSGFKEIAV